MNTEQAIKVIEWLSAMATWPQIVSRPEYVSALELALDALRAQQERENPKPLTLDDLMDMDSEVVYASYKRPTKPGKPWESVTQPFLVDAHRFMRLVGTDTTLPFDRWKKTWLAYDHEPHVDVEAAEPQKGG